MKIRNFWSACAMVLSVIMSSHASAADTVALVSDVSGDVIVKVDSSSSPAQLLAPIPLGARIDLQKGAKLSLIYVAKGDEFKLSGPGVYQIDASSPQTISGSTPAKLASLGGVLSGKKIRPENVAQATLTMRSIKKVQHSLEPLRPSSSVVLADPLQLRWQEPAAGLVYQIQVIDSLNKVLMSKETAGNKFTLPQETTLVSGDYYVWNISTTMPDGSLVTSSAKFRVASNEVREQAAKLRPGKEGSVSERIAYGLWLEGENFANEARLVWDELATEFPDQPNFRDRAALKP